MQQLDLSGVHPLHWEKARQRARAVEDYVSNHYRDGAERDRLAEELGISTSLFLRIVRAWRAGKGVAGLGLNLSGPARALRKDVCAASWRIMQSTIEEMGSSAPLVDVRNAILGRCAKANLAPPTKATIHNYLMQARAAAPSIEHEPEIIVGIVLLKIPGRPETGQPLRPKMVIAAEASTRRILAHLPLAGASPEAFAIFVGQMLQHPTSAPLAIDQALARQLPVGMLSDRHYELRTSALIARKLSAVFGSGLHGLAMLYQPSSGDKQSGGLCRRSPSSMPAAIGKVVAAAINKHNAERAQSLRKCLDLAA